MNRIRQNLFNAIDKVIQPLIEQSLPEQAELLTNALRRLKNAITIKASQELKEILKDNTFQGLSVQQVSLMQLMTCDEMLEARVSENERSLKEILTEANLFEPVIISLQDPNSYLSKISRSVCYLSTITAIDLCGLVQNGDLDAIKRQKISSYRVNELVTNAVISVAAGYMGFYNPTHIAAAEHQLEILKYFVEQKNAQLNIKAGRLSDMTALDCANTTSWLYPTSHNDVVAYLEEKTLEQTPRAEKMSYKEAYEHTFLAPPTKEVTINAVAPEESNWSLSKSV